MRQAISESTLSRFSDFIARTMGLHLPPARWPDLVRGLSAAARELGHENVEECALQMMFGPLTERQSNALADHLTVGETYFFREPAIFDILANRILPDLVRQRRNEQRHLRIWSAACCTGEEPYSIAMILHETIPDLDNWNITVLATDISPRSLAKAEKGVYGPWSFRGGPVRMKDRYFRPAGDGQFAIAPEIKRLVRFANLNLVEDGYPSLANDTNAMDVIFCRNVLMYFTEPNAKKAIHNFHRAQMEGGWLIVSSSELFHLSGTPYAVAKFPGATLYRKDGSGVHAAPPPQHEAHVEFAPAQPLSIAALPPLPPLPLLPPPPLPSPSAAERYAQAAEFYEQGEYDLALRAVEASLIVNPSEPAALELMTRCLANQGRLAEAHACCDLWIGADKLNPAVHYLKAVILQEQNSIPPAVASLRKALYLDPNFVLAHFALGALARRRGNVHDADRHLNAALRLLREHKPDFVLPESEGMTAGRLAQLVGALMPEEVTA